MRWPTRSRSDGARRDAGHGDEPVVAVLLPEPLGGQVDALVARGRQVEAIRLVRVRTGLALVPAHRAVAHRAPPGG